VDYPDGSFVRYAYDAGGRLASIETPGGATSFGYDSTGRLVNVSDTQAGATIYAYDLSGRVSQVLLPDGSTTSYTRNSRGWVTDLRAMAADGVTILRDESFTYDSAGNRLHTTELGREVTYGFDAAGRIVAESRTGADPGTLAYSYDADWNLLQKGGQTLSYDGYLRLTGDGIWTSYTYDAAGRPVTRSRPGLTQQFSYDSLGRLTGVSQTGGIPSQISLEYDGNDLLNRVVVDGVGRRLLWDPASSVPRLLEERTDANDLLRRYVYGLGPVAVVDETGVHAIHRDALGSVRLITSSNGNMTQYAFDAYGDQTVGLADGTSSLRYAGELFLPELGLYYLRARFYDPAAGRFLTPDPLEPTPDLPLTYNPYLYASGNPVRFTDPTGMAPTLVEQFAVQIIQTTLVTIALHALPTAITLVARQFGVRPQQIPFSKIHASSALVNVERAFKIKKFPVDVGAWASFSRGTVQNKLELGFFVAGHIPKAHLGRTPGHAPRVTFWAGPTLSSEDLPDVPELTETFVGFVFISGTVARALSRGVVVDRWSQVSLGLVVDWSLHLTKWPELEHTLTILGNVSLAALPNGMALHNFVLDALKPPSPWRAKRVAAETSVEVGLYFPIYQRVFGGGLPPTQQVVIPVFE
jgi:RHS repeat-associated protein